MFATAGLQELVCCVHFGELRVAEEKKKAVLLTSSATLPPKRIVWQLPPFVFSALSLSLVLSSSSSSSPPTHCSTMSAGDLIEQIDCKWNQGVWVNQSNTVKQFFGHEGISLACVELIRSHSPPVLAGLLGPRATASLAPRRTTHAPLSMLHCL